MARTKYAKEVGRSLRPSTMFSISAYFTPALADNDQCPLMVYDDRFSRFALTMVDGLQEKGKKRVVNGNIPMNYVADVIARSKYAFNRHMEAELTPQSSTASSGNSSAYSVRMASGFFKGKTPAEVLMADGNNLEQLRNQYKYLKDNLAKYPGNKQQMDAIENAVNLFKNGELGQSEAPSNILIPIYHAEARSLIRKPREDGMCPVYEVHVDWQTGEKSPVTVNVVNFYAPVNKLEGGRINPVVSQKDNSTYASISYHLQEWEWMDMISGMERAMRIFEEAYAKKLVQDAEEADRLNRQEGAQNNW